LNIQNQREYCSLMANQSKKSEKPAENKQFNDTLKRMLNTPPKPHKAEKKKSKD